MVIIEHKKLEMILIARDILRQIFSLKYWLPKINNSIFERGL